MKRKFIVGRSNLCISILKNGDLVELDMDKQLILSINGFPNSSQGWAFENIINSGDIFSDEYGWVEIAGPEYSVY